VIRWAAGERLAIAAVLCAMALVVLDAGMVGVALPTIARTFAEPPAGSLMVVTAYQLALLMGLLPCAHIADRVGHRRLFASGILLFAGSAVLCALATTFPLLVAARFLQGLGGAAIMALGVALLRSALGAERLTSAIGWNALVVAFCSALGPAAGALLLSIADWRWLFLIALPTAAAALIAAGALPPEKASARPLDPRGVALYAAAVACLVAGVQAVRWAPLGAFLLGAAALCLGRWLIARERFKPAPLIPLDLLALRPFRASAAASLFFFTGQSAGLLALPFYIQLSLGRSAAAAGLILALWPVAVIIVSPIATRLAGRLEAGSLCAAGGLLLAVGLVGMALWPVGETIAPLAAFAMVSGAGFGLFQVPNNRTMFLAAPRHRSAAAGGLQGSARLAGQTAGALLVALVLSAAPPAVAPQIAFCLAAAAALIAAWMSGRENVSQAYLYRAICRLLHRRSFGPARGLRRESE
jgi:DHA2 family multidrug resistance protein-like MFS transporter